MFQVRKIIPKMPIIDQAPSESINNKQKINIKETNLSLEKEKDINNFVLNTNKPTEPSNEEYKKLAEILKVYINLFCLKKKEKKFIQEYVKKKNNKIIKSEKNNLQKTNNLDQNSENIIISKKNNHTITNSKVWQGSVEKAPYNNIEKKIIINAIQPQLSEVLLEKNRILQPNLTNESKEKMISNIEYEDSVMSQDDYTDKDKDLGNFLFYTY